jgi:hypothetical protein
MIIDNKNYKQRWSKESKMYESQFSYWLFFFIMKDSGGNPHEALRVKIAADNLTANEDVFE